MLKRVARAKKTVIFRPGRQVDSKEKARPGGGAFPQLSASIFFVNIIIRAGRGGDKGLLACRRRAGRGV